MAGVVAAAVAVAACGSSELDVDPSFDGEWTVTMLDVTMLDVTMLDVGESADDGAPGLLEAIAAPLVVEIDTGEAAIRGRTGCGRIFGSYTLTHDRDSGTGDSDSGDAHFTLPSPAPADDCPTAERRAHEALVAALERVNRWQQQGATLEFRETASPDQTLLELSPAG